MDNILPETSDVISLGNIAVVFIASQMSLKEVGWASSHTFGHLRRETRDNAVQKEHCMMKAEPSTPSCKGVPRTDGSTSSCQPPQTSPDC